MEIHCSHTELKDPGGLIPHPKNPNTHPQAQIELLARIIKHQGWRNPIVVSQRSGFIIAGHARLKAAQLLELDKVPVDYQDFETEADEWAHLAADNKLAELAEPDQAILAELLQDLKAEGFDTILAGFDEINLAEIIEEAQPDQVEVDAEPQIEEAQQLAEKWNVKKGQVWELGAHRLICGDSGDTETVESLMEGQPIKAVVTDPPYGINANKQTLGTGQKNFHRGDDWDGETPSMQSILSLKVPTIIWGGNYFDLPSNNDWLCWHKKNDGLSFSEFELAWTNLGKNCRLFSHHWSGEVKKHPTMKPLPVMVWCVNQISESEIFEPFIGSGSTLMACEQTGRACRGIELQPQYIAVTIQRWADATGGEPKLVK